TGGVADRAWVEPLALVRHLDHDLLAIEAHFHTDRFARVATVPVQNGVRERLRQADTEVQVEAAALERARTTPTLEISDGRLDQPQVARQLERESGFVHDLQRRAPSGCFGAHP